ncbi:hypothetical protein MSAN_01086300 [Mycena sanguinolenta]|uniref:Uncharacterized protein n=1 Tax=Mycena sanguinolenta TaxID=230812 RepID=A0A8H6YUT4_9AGAR|nr:hypothetical protein MSAN_01086300 [Mycena sanguinolenta]
MFLSASIALTSLFVLSKFIVHSAPVTARGIIEQWCTGPNGSGDCTVLPANTCTSTPGIQSLILNADADCAAFPLPNCDFTGTQPALELFSDDSQSIGDRGIQSVNCGDFAGTVNGFTKGSSQDISQEAEDKAAGIAIVGSE